jgi:hypothetical protein
VCQSVILILILILILTGNRVMWQNLQLTRQASRGTCCCFFFTKIYMFSTRVNSELQIFYHMVWPLGQESASRTMGGETGGGTSNQRARGHGFRAAFVVSVPVRGPFPLPRLLMQQRHLPWPIRFRCRRPCQLHT